MGGRRLAAALAAALILAAGCGGAGPARELPNVLLITIDSLRADSADGVSSALPTGPRVRELAGQGVVFTRAVSTAPWTTPSMMSVMTGLYPWSHHVRDHNFSLAPDVPLLSERLREMGYATAAVVPSATLREDFGFARGFDLYSNGRYGHFEITSPRMTGLALSWLAENADRPFFCWVHYWDPHYNYLPPEPFRKKFPTPFRPEEGKRYDLTVLKNSESPLREEEAAYLRSQYSGEILYTDRYVGDLLDFLDDSGLRERTLVVLHGDHGEGFQEHGWLTHTMRVYEEMIRVPLVLRWPGRLPAGKRIETAVPLVGLAPTILDLIGAEVPAEEMEGESLLPLMTSEGSSEDGTPAPILSETIRQAALAAWRRGDWKYILNLDSCSGELYDLAADPGETRDLTAAEPERAAALREEILDYYRHSPHAGRVPVVRMERIDPDNLDQLQALGYISRDRFGDVLTYSGRTDPLHCE